MAPSEPWGIVPTKPCRPERQLTCTHAHLLALRSAGVDVSECAHGWVDDASIAYEVSHGQDVDLLVPHNEHTNRAARIATMVRLRQRGVVFDPLWLIVGQHDGRLTYLHLRDGHHRLRAAQWQTVHLRGSVCLAWNVGGDLVAVGLLRTMLGR